MIDELCLVSARILGNPLVAAECISVTGALPDADGVAVCRSLDYIPQSAYLTTGLRCLAEAPTLDELVSQVSGMSFPAERFLLEILRVSPGLPKRDPSMKLAVADAIQANPDLTHPQHRFLVVESGRGLWLGEIVNECLYSYRRHEHKPHTTSSSLPARLSRALVNLVYPRARSILDPFCGTGSLLLEAQMLGLSAYGLDLNPNMVEMARGNLEHFGYTAQVEAANALDCTWTADAIVTDLPYGHFPPGINRPVLLAALHHLAPLAPQAIYVAGENLFEELLRAGYRQVRVFEVYKRKAMNRYVHWALRG